MATAFSHPAIALALRLVGGSRVVSRRLLIAAAICTVLPDVDAIGYWLGVPYQHLFGHRGLTHSVFFAVAVGWAASRYSAFLGVTRKAAFWVIMVATASHGLLDAFTNGGLGVAFLSPFSNQRWFFPWKPIVVSPISISGFFEPRSWSVLASELAWIWLPAVSIGLLLGALRSTGYPSSR